MFTRKIELLFVVLLLSLVQVPAIAGGLDSQGRELYRDGEVIVKYRSGAVRTRSSANQLYERLNVLELRRFSPRMEEFEHLLFQENTMGVEEAVQLLEQDSSVEYAHPNYIVYTLPIAEEVEVAEAPCILPGIPFPPGCVDQGTGGNPGNPGEPGEEVPCIAPGIPFPPGCVDPGNPGNPGEPGEPGEEVPCIAPGIPFPPGCVDPGNPGNPGNPSPNRPPIEDVSEEPDAASDPDLSKAYGIEKVGAIAAWDIQKGSKDVVVAVIDTGVDYNHPDLAFNMWRNPNTEEILKTGIDSSGSNISGDIVGWDFIHDDNLPYDDNMHGTHCAGIIGAVGNNGEGVSGVAQRVSIMAVKFLDSAGSGDIGDAIAAIDYAVSRGAKILSNSWGGEGGTGAEAKALKEVIERSKQAGALFVAAAGNSSSNNDVRPVIPASIKVDNIIAVASTDSQDNMSFFSNYGPASVHIGAPGSGVYSTTPGGTYRSLSGTSMAAPHVAGAAALVWAQFPEATYSEIKKRLIASGDSIESLTEKTISGKRLNVFNALQDEL